MKYDVSGKDGIPFPHGHGRVLDANGVVLSPLRWCDTETGEVVRYVMKDGKFTVGPDHRVATARETHPAPLRLVPREPDSADEPIIVEAAAC